ncbi:MAG: HmuY family protein [Cyclobacteriaceae bacterium]
MKFLNYLFAFVIISSFSLAISSCSDDDPAPIPVVSTTFSDLDADYAPFEPIMGPPTGPPKRIGETNEFTFFDFATGQIVSNADSATANWDIGFRRTEIIFNSGSSGPGTTTGQIVQGIFDELSEAPETGFKSDDETSGNVISSSPNVDIDNPANFWWRNGGSGSSTIVSPIAGQVIVVKTSQNRYAKMEILSYYKGAPSTPNNMTDLDRHYTFRYVYQPNDTRVFE